MRVATAEGILARTRPVHTRRDHTRRDHTRRDRPALAPADITDIVPLAG